MKSRTLMMNRSLLKSLLRSSLLKSHSLMKWKITVKSRIRDLDPLIHLITEMKNVLLFRSKLK